MTIVKAPTLSGLFLFERSARVAAVMEFLVAVEGCDA